MARLREEAGAAMTDTILGFDLSSRKLAMTGIQGDDHFVRTWEAPKKEKDRAKVIAGFIDPLTELFTTHSTTKGDLWVFVEHPLRGRAGVHATIVQAQVQGLVLGLAVQYGAHGAYHVNVTTWKKAVVGNGSADKERVRTWLATHQPVLAALAGDDQDLVDASCVALYGRSVIGRGRKLKLKHPVQLDT
jgi:Holliday junction resolvasome RuvABC endonuclease subunit